MAKAKPLTDTQRAVDVELEDQGEPDQDGIELQRGADNRLRFLLDIDNMNRVAVRQQDGHAVRLRVSVTRTCSA